MTRRNLLKMFGVAAAIPVASVATPSVVEAQATARAWVFYDSPTVNPDTNNFVISCQFMVQKTGQRTTGFATVELTGGILTWRSQIANAIIAAAEAEGITGLTANNVFAPDMVALG
jgi:hypothetical protein